MNKRYIDFVPSKKTTGTGASRATGGVVKKPATRTVGTSVTRSAVKSGTRTPKVMKPVAKTAPKVTRAMPKPAAGGTRKRTLIKSTKRANAPKLGVIEELSLAGTIGEVVEKPAVVKLTRNVAIETTSKTMAQPASKTAKKEAYKIPKTPFINQNSVVKRPLSKNVYQKKVVTPVEKPTGPVTIISKPKKEKHTSLIVTIIITIILGAAAGTVAFLLLPK